MGEDQTLVTEVPSSLKQLARLVVRGFYSIEDTLIIDMLVRNPCMKEDDMCELLRFEKKMLRARVSTLKADKFIQVRLKMETGEDGKAQKVNYYFINYKVLSSRIVEHTYRYIISLDPPFCDQGVCHVKTCLS